MDPLTALSLAACIAQFIDFGTRLVCKTKEVVEAGSTVSVQHLSTITSDLVGINSSLKKKIEPKSGADNVKLTKEEEALHDLTSQCNKVAQELIDCLNEVTVTDHKRHRWTSVRAALKTFWSKEHIEGLAQRLSDFRAQLSLRVLLLLNSHYEMQDEKLDLLHQHNKEIVEVVSINFGHLRSTIEGHHQREDSWQQEESLKAEERHAETIAAILTSRDGNSRTVTGPHYSADFSAQVSRPGNVQTATTYRQIRDGSGQSVLRPPDFETNIFTNVAQKILDALHFRSIADRRAAIPAAHRKTFQWIYQDPASCDKPWDSLSNWLKTGTGCYWINGKAGSGKSTLMKYLQEDSRTVEALREWAGSSGLVIGSFFFWYAGTPIQKSQIGLLRSLLLDVLYRRPELVPVLFPEICRAMLAKQLSDRIELSYIELEKAFMAFVKSVPEGLKVFFMIDGVDEYEGDHNELAELLSHATLSDSVKILLSSRPIPACVQAFSGCPTLRVQDLTYNDVKNYVEDKLGQDPLMQKLEMAESGATLQLINSITSKASGVLLWVVLVVKRLRNGLQDYDTISDLLQKLDELPPSLEKLYDHMLGSMSPRNRRQGSKLLQLVMRSTEIQGDYPMTVLQLSFAEDDDYRRGIEGQVSKLSTQEESWRCEATEGRMRSRCSGLIEVQDPPSLLEVNKAGGFVGFLHRTVIDFLQADTIWIQLISLTKDTKFDVDQALFSSSLCEMKAKPPMPGQKRNDSPALNSMLRMLTYEQHIEDENNRNLFRSTYLPELRNTMGYYWHDRSLFHSPEFEMQVITASTNRCCSRLKLSYPESFLISAASHCPHEQFSELLDLFYPPDMLETERRTRKALLAACLLLQYLEDVQSSLRPTLAKNIIACNATPDARITLHSSLRKLWNNRWKDADSNDGTYELWDFVLHSVYSMTNYSGQNFFDFVHTSLSESFFNILIAMIQGGANVHRTIIISSTTHTVGWMGCREVSAYYVLNQFMLRVWNVRTPSIETEKNALAPTVLLGLDDDALADNVCRIEALMKSMGSVISSRDLSSTTQREPRHPKRQRKMLRDLQMRSKAPVRGLQSTPERLKVPTDQSSKPSVEDISRTSTVKSYDQEPGPSPWTQYKLHSHAPAARDAVATALNTTDRRYPKQWDSTPRDSRIKLLDLDEQKLAADLSCALTAHDKRLALNRMSRLPYQKQAQILECSKLLQQKQHADSATET